MAKIVLGENADKLKIEGTIDHDTGKAYMRIAINDEDIILDMDESVDVTLALVKGVKEMKQKEEEFTE
jgi:hypothetical protein